MSLYPLDDRDPDGRGMPGDMRYDYERTQWRRDIERRGRERRAMQRAVLSALLWGWKYGTAAAPSPSAGSGTTPCTVDGCGYAGAHYHHDTLDGEEIVPT